MMSTPLRGAKEHLRPWKKSKSAQTTAEFTTFGSFNNGADCSRLSETHNYPQNNNAKTNVKSTDDVDDFSKKYRLSDSRTSERKTSNTTSPKRHTMAESFPSSISEICFVYFFGNAAQIKSFIYSSSVRRNEHENARMAESSPSRRKRKNGVKQPIQKILHKFKQARKRTLPQQHQCDVLFQRVL